MVITQHTVKTGHAVAFLPFGELEKLLEFPKGIRIRGVAVPDALRRGLRFLIEGDGLPYCEEGREPVLMDLQGHIAYIDDEQRYYTKISLALPEQKAN